MAQPIISSLRGYPGRFFSSRNVSGQFLDIFTPPSQTLHEKILVKKKTVCLWIKFLN